MLYIGHLIILDGQSIKKNNFRKVPFLELLRLQSCISRLCPRPLGSPPPPPTPKWGEKHTKCFHHCKWSQYQKNVLQKFPFLTCRGWKTA